jgi:hypothetical protein
VPEVCLLLIVDRNTVKITLLVTQRKVEEAIIIKNEDFPTIPSFIYSSFWNAHCVKQLSISHCNITSIPEGICALISLELMILDNNRLTSLPKSLGRIYALKCLDVSNNRLANLPEELSNLKNLQLLNISNNLFEANKVPNCIHELEIWSEIEGKLEGWDDIIMNERLRRATLMDDEEKKCDADVLAEKEKEIQRLLANMS